MSYQTKTVCHNVGPYSRIETNLFKADDGSLTIGYKAISGGVLEVNRIVLPAEVVQQLLPGLEQAIELDRRVARMLEEHPECAPKGYTPAAPSTFAIAIDADDDTEHDAGDDEPSRLERKHIVEDFDLDED